MANFAAQREKNIVSGGALRHPGGWSRPLAFTPSVRVLPPSLLYVRCLSGVIPGVQKGVNSADKAAPWEAQGHHQKQYFFLVVGQNSPCPDSFIRINY